MEQLPQLFKALDLDLQNEDLISQEFIDVFKNPNCWPIDQMHLEQTNLELIGQPKSKTKHFKPTTQMVPALDKSWLPVTPPLYKFHPYNFTTTTTKEDNSVFLINNRLFLQNVKYLLRCNYHHFWCLVLFEPEVTATLHSFLLNPIIPYEIVEMDEECVALYDSIFKQFLLVYRRLITFHQSEVVFHGKAGTEKNYDGVGLFGFGLTLGKDSPDHPYLEKIAMLLTKSPPNPFMKTIQSMCIGLFLSSSGSLCACVTKRLMRCRVQLLTYCGNKQTEFMSEEVGLKHLLDKKLLNLPTVLTLIYLYQETNSAFVGELVRLFFGHDSAFRDREVEEMLGQVVMTLEMIGGHLCGFEKDAVIVPIAVDERPKVFSLNWVYSIVNYLLNTVSTLHVLLKYSKSAVEMAFHKGVPFRLSYTYERVYCSLYEMLNERQELVQNERLTRIIYDEISIGRSEFIEIYNSFTMFCLAQALMFSDNLLRQQEHVETYLQLMASALEDEYFICDYNERYSVKAQNENFKCCSDIDETRSDYIVTCIESFRRHNRLWKALKQDSKILNKTVSRYARSKKLKSKENAIAQMPEASTSSDNVNGFKPPSEQEIENLITMVVDMFPHLGDGFVLKCLEAYDYQTSEVISAILENNLPPHIIDIPFDEIRIPPEPEPAKPILAYKGKKPGYDDALKLLNDRTDAKQIKTFIMDGIQYSNEYDMYDDEFDDRLDEPSVPVRDQGSEDVLTYNPNHADDDAVSDTSYSDNDYDERGEIVKENPQDKPKGKGANFCEDPAVIRARREAKRAEGRGGGCSRGGGRDVVGKPRGQGQDKNVQNSREKKNTNKSSRANHSRKSGAQWKRNKGMVPS